MKFSIIVPMYNAADTVNRALESVKKQKYTDYEVIVVDDGSEQECELSGAINGVYVYQRNQGAGAARNRGLMNAWGEYVLFLDADDELAVDNVLGYIANNVSGKDALYMNIREQGDTYTKQRSAKDMGSACGVAYRREFLLQNDIWFPRIPQMEDVAFNTIVQNCGAKIDIKPFESYVYRVDKHGAEKSNYRVTALPWIVKSSMYVFGYFYPRNKSVAYSQSVSQLSFIYWYYNGAKSKLSMSQEVEFWAAMGEWEDYTATIKTVESSKTWADYFIQRDKVNKIAAENIVGKGDFIMPAKQFFETILGRAWRSVA